MWTIPKLVLAVIASAAAASPAMASRWGPPDTRSAVAGVLTFDAAGPPVQCRVKMIVRTGHGGPAMVESAMTEANRKPCSRIKFDHLPWRLRVTGPNSGELHGFVDGDRNVFECSEFRRELVVTTTTSGQWTFPPGNCVVGSLNSNPPVYVQ